MHPSPFYSGFLIPLARFPVIPQKQKLKPILSHLLKIKSNTKNAKTGLKPDEYLV